MTLTNFPDQARVKGWISGINLFCGISNDPCADFLTAETNLNKNDRSFISGAGIIATAAFDYHLENEVLGSLLKIADLTGIAALRFTAAWTAFNMNDFETCITECEKIEDHGYHVYGLMGQAQLESGNPVQAIDTLTIALRMNEKDPALWFQLSKANYVLGSNEAAWYAVDSCIKSGGQGAECAIMRCAIASAAHAQGSPDASDYIESAFEFLKEVYPVDNNKHLLAIYATKMAMFTDCESAFIKKMDYYRKQTSSDGIEKLRPEIAEILRQLQSRQWFEGAQIFLAIISGCNHNLSKSN